MIIFIQQTKGIISNVTLIYQFDFLMAIINK